MSRPILLASIAVAGLLVYAIGCTSMFEPRSHSLMNLTEEVAEVNDVALPIPRELAKALLPEHRIEPGDVLLVEPVEFDASIRLAGDKVVQPDGAIELGRFGRLQVVGKTVNEIRADVERRIEQRTGERIEINVRLLEMEGTVYYVLGEVNSPGAYPLKGNETVLDAIIAAGGITDEADRSNIILSKPSLPDECRVVLPICYQHIVQLGDTSTNYQLAPGDRVFVSSESFWEFLLFWLPNRETCPACSNPQFGCAPNGTRTEHFQPSSEAGELPLPEPDPPAPDAAYELESLGRDIN